MPSDRGGSQEFSGSPQIIPPQGTQSGSVVAYPAWKNATSILIAINVAVFAAMVFKDHSAFMAPSNEQLVKWGADFGPLTLDNQPWRLVTSGFLHIGILHIAVNMWSLWILGRLTERFVGITSLFAIYLLTGIGASLASLAWNPVRVSAGASGPIFGFVGSMIGILYFAKARLDPVARKNLLSYVVRIAVINLFIGLTAGIDNMAHAGGLVTGAVIGSALALTAKWQTQNRTMLRLGIFAVTFVVLLMFYSVVKDKRHDLVLAYQGQDALERKDYGTAIARLEECAKLDPNDESVHATLGYAYQSANKPDAAMKEYERALAINPETPEVKIELARLYSASGKRREAIGLFSQAIDKVKPDASTYKLYADILAANGQYKEAEAALKRAIQLDGIDADWHMELGELLEMDGDKAGAAAEYKIGRDLQNKETAPKGKAKP